MFDAQIDVAAIMQEIKESVIPEEMNEDELCELQRITEFIENTRRETDDHVNIGYVLPEMGKYPIFLKKVARFLLRVIRKSLRFITNDQIIVNKNLSACVKALVERENALIKEYDMKISYLAEENEKLRQDIEKLKRKTGVSNLSSESIVDIEKQ